jgi:hypothetical protein
MIAASFLYNYIVSLSAREELRATFSDPLCAVILFEVDLVSALRVSKESFGTFDGHFGKNGNPAQRSIIL